MPKVMYMAAGYGLPAGIEAHLLHYATELCNHGFETGITVFYPLPSVPHRFLAALRERGIPIRSLNQEAKNEAAIITALAAVPWMIREAVNGHFHGPSRLFSWVVGRRGVSRLGQVIRTERPDIVHVFGRLPTDAWKELPPERTIFHEMMTGTVDQHWNEKELTDFRVFAERTAGVFAPGSGVAENMKREFGIKREIVPIFTMAPDECGGKLLERLRGGGPAGLRFGILCRLTEQKGISYLLEAIRRYRDKHGNIKFIFAGQGDLDDTIRRFVADNGLNNVRIESVESAVNTLRNIDVFVHPSVDDAMPVSIAEAMMCGCPCVVSRVGGCPDLVRDGLDGFVIEPRRPEQILDGMERFAQMGDEEFLRFRQNARRRYEDVCLPANVGKVVAGHYREIMGSGAGKSRRCGSVCGCVSQRVRG